MEGVVFTLNGAYCTSTWSTSGVSVEGVGAGVTVGVVIGVGAGVINGVAIGVGTGVGLSVVAGGGAVVVLQTKESERESREQQCARSSGLHDAATERDGTSDAKQSYSTPQ